MQSSMCKAKEHEVCGKVLQLPNGKTFRCSCECHYEIEMEEIDEFTDDDSEFE